MSKKISHRASITNRPTCGGPRKAGLAPRSTNFMMGVKRNHKFNVNPINKKMLLDYPDTCYDWITEHLTIIRGYLTENNWFQPPERVIGTNFDLVLAGEKELLNGDLKNKEFNENDVNTFFYHLYSDQTNNEYNKMSNRIKKMVDKVNAAVPETFNTATNLGKHRLAFIDRNRISQKSGNKFIEDLMDSKYGYFEWKDLQLIFSWEPVDSKSLRNWFTSEYDKAKKDLRKTYNSVKKVVKKVGGEVSKHLLSYAKDELKNLGIYDKVNSLLRIFDREIPSGVIDKLSELIGDPETSLKQNVEPYIKNLPKLVKESESAICEVADLKKILETIQELEEIKTLKAGAAAGGPLETLIFSLQLVVLLVLEVNDLFDTKSNLRIWLHKFLSLLHDIFSKSIPDNFKLPDDGLPCWATDMLTILSFVLTLVSEFNYSQSPNQGAIFVEFICGSLEIYDCES